MLARFYLIVDHVDWLGRFLPLGLKLVQLRLKDLLDADIRAQIAAAREQCAAHGCQLVVNDYWRAALDLGCDFIHLGQEDLAQADMAAIRAGGLKLGISTHDHAELARALIHKPDYVALGPIYPTILKAMKFAPQGLQRIGEWKRFIGDMDSNGSQRDAGGKPVATFPRPALVAIGGITLERAADVYAAGADSICVVTDVLRAVKPEDRVKAWLKAARERGADG